MKTMIERVIRFRHRFGWLGTVALMLPVLAWAEEFTGQSVWGIFHLQSPALSELISGDMFAKTFYLRSMGTGDPHELLFWFTLVSVTSLPWALLVRWLSDRNKRGAYRAYAFCGMLLGIPLFCMLLFPLIWLIRYVNRMGVTPRRVQGLIYCAVWGGALIGFIVSCFIRRNTGQGRDWKSAVAVIVAVPATLFVLTNAESWAVSVVLTLLRGSSKM